MKAVRCKNGHWYDSETYDRCPHCGQLNNVTEESTVIVKNEKQRNKGLGLFRREKKSQSNVVPMTVENNYAKGSETQPVSSAIHNEVTERFFDGIDDEKTMSMFAMENTPDIVKKKTISEPLSVAVQRVSAMDEGKTLSYFNAMTNQGNPTENDVSKKDCEPVVGWLVAISGVHFGESFQIYVGKNTIGRSQGNKIVLGLDNGVSRENHATIIYEPKRREFYLQSGNSDGLIYLNDSFVNGSEILKAKDTLEIGATKLIFIPLCGTDFSWEQYM